ncbi:MAG: S8 family peptidase [Coriobacteriales bacterium]|nr:S8 family peptidase [Coriobacteriales bacterium]
MNDLLRLKGRFDSAPSSGSRGRPSLPKGQCVDAEHLLALANDIQVVATFWDSVSIRVDPLVCVFYNRVIAKSNRVQKLLGSLDGTASEHIVGAKYDIAPDLKRRHVITYSVKRAELGATEKLLRECAAIVEHYFGGTVTDDDLANVSKNDLPSGTSSFSSMRKTTFSQVIKDAFYVWRFDIPQNIEDDELDWAFVSLYETGRDTFELLREVGIDNLVRNRVLGNSVLLSREQYAKLRHRAPYLVSMELEDLSDWTGEDFGVASGLSPAIPSPSNEPTVGVIDTPFDKRVYCTDWVDYEPRLDPSIQVCEADYEHGTSVSSIIVDGPALNPELEDDCGRFKVKHFGVATKTRFSSFAVMRNIEEIVADNPSIKVWNLSLGSEMEIRVNSISPEADILDRIQTQYDVIFVVAGTNKTSRDQTRIGAPADSINAIVVNSVDRDGTVVDYARSGPVLSFFGKPDVSYYGGTKANPIMTAAPFMPVAGTGTSLAAPWITRKVAYLIYICGLTREIAKALIVDSSIGWENEPFDSQIGYGVVPKSIKDVLRCKNDEIRFVLNGVASAYNTYAYNIPVPMRDDMFPYVARATLCYFPQCNRNQGVDYTNIEMDLHFGRLFETKTGASVKPLNGNVQGMAGAYLNEDDARTHFRKWDSIKHISDKLTPRARSRRSYMSGSNLWGIKIFTTERADRPSSSKHLPFGLVITLREINGVNRINEFKQQCMARNWIVSPIDIDQSINIYEAAEVDIEFEDE